MHPDYSKDIPHIRVHRGCEAVDRSALLLLAGLSLTSLVQQTIPFLEWFLGTRDLKYWVPGSSGITRTELQSLLVRGMIPLKPGGFSPFDHRRKSPRRIPNIISIMAFGA